MQGVVEWVLDPVASLHRLAFAAAEFARQPASAVAAVVGAVVTAGVSVLMRHRAARAADARTVTIGLPENADAAGAQAFWAAMLGLLRPRWRRAVFGQPHLAFEYIATHAGACIQLWVPGRIPPGLVERAVSAAWPGARTSITDPKPSLPKISPLTHRLLYAGGTLRLARAGLPIRHEFHPAADPLRILFGAVEDLAPGGHITVQILARPLVQRRAGATTPISMGTGFAAQILTHVIRAALDILTPGPSRRQQPAANTQHGHQARIAAHEYERAAAMKSVRPQYETLIRYGVFQTASLDATAQELDRARGEVTGRAAAVAGAFAVYSGLNHYRRKRFSPASALGHRRLRRGDMLSIPELAAVAHLPNGVPGLEFASARAIAPPAHAPLPGPDSKTLGVSDTGHERAIALRAKDARQHMHVIGPTGTGKSTLLAQLALADINSGRAVVVIDPKGDLVNDILARLPRPAARRVILVDAGDPTNTPWLNPLSTAHTSPSRAVDALATVFTRIYGTYWGPRTDDVFRMSCLTLLGHGGSHTLADVPRLLTDAVFRDHVTASVGDADIAQFWREYSNDSDAARAARIAPLMNKLRAFLTRPFIRSLLTGENRSRATQQTSQLDLAAALNTGGVVLIRIPEDDLGEETCRLLGSLLFAAIWHATTARAGIAEPERRDACLIVDEAHYFLHLPITIERMLAAARGYRLAIVLAHQHLAQLARDLREGITANALTKVIFRASPDDAAALARQTGPVLTAQDLQHLNVFHTAVRLLIDGEQSRPFTMRTNPLPHAPPDREQRIRRLIAKHQNPSRSQPQSARPRAGDPRGS